LNEKYCPSIFDSRSLFFAGSVSQDRIMKINDKKNRFFTVYGFIYNFISAGNIMIYRMNNYKG
jgi:hypothetical protein